MRNIGDVILIYYEDKPALFGRIEHIESDIKKDWYQLTLLLLTIPTQTVTWILREEYIDGATFTMGGKGMRLEEVAPVPLEKDLQKDDQLKKKDGSSSPGKVIPFNKPPSS